MAKIIHQTLKTTTIPHYLQFCMDSWKVMNPDYEYILWTDETAREYIRTTYPKYLNGFDKVTGIQKSDLLRLLVVHGYGGIYADSDFECLRRIPFEIGTKLSVAYEPDGHVKRICNALFSAPAGCDELLVIADDGLDYVGSECPLKVWGPTRWSESLKNRMDTIDIIDWKTIYPIRDVSLASVARDFPEDSTKLVTKNFGNAWAVHYWDHSNWQQHRWNMLSQYHKYVSPKRTITELSICAIFRNNEEYLKTFFIPTFERVESMYPSIKFNYYLYENDSSDETPTIVKSLGGVSEILDKPVNKRDTSKTRINAIAAARDKLMAQRPFKGEWCMFIDSNIEFPPNLISRFIARELPDDAACVTCFGLDDHNPCRKHNNCDKQHYYDTFALLYKDGSHMVAIEQPDLGPSCCPFSDKEEVQKWNNGHLVETRSSFGGVAFYKTDEVNKPTMFYGDCDIGRCEHTYFNSRLDGKVYADPTLEVHMTERIEPEKKLIGMPSTMSQFIGRLPNQPPSRFDPGPFSQLMARASSQFAPGDNTLTGSIYDYY